VLLIDPGFLCRKTIFGQFCADSFCEVQMMSSYTPPPPGSQSGSRIEELLRRIETEVRGVANYVNSSVVPPIRRESVSAMRSLSETLKNLADRMEKHSTKGPQE
jgi:hypothetical protein